MGAMGMVWAGEHGPTGTPTALKFVRGNGPRGAELSNLVAREVRAVARLAHPSIVKVFDYGRVSAALSEETRGILMEGAPWIAMELLGAELQVSGWKSIADTALCLLDALGHAHARQTLHRDIKPSNIATRRSDGRPVLLDFGLASIAGDESMFASALGTPHYAAPEQIRGDSDAQGPWTDLYALGATLWQWTAGTTLFEHPERDAVLASHLDPARPALPSALELPPGASAWLERLVAYDPADRPQHAAHAAAELRSILAGGGQRFGWPAPCEPSLERALKHSDTDVQLSGVGLELLALREPDVVGRLKEQKRLWVLATAAISGLEGAERVCAVVSTARGEAERLGAWMTRSLAAQGAARIVSVPDEPDALRIVAAALGGSVEHLRAADTRAVMTKPLGPSVADEVEKLVGEPGAAWSLAAAARVTLAAAQHAPTLLIGQSGQAADWVVSACRSAPANARIFGLCVGVRGDGPVVEVRPLAVLGLVQTLRQLAGLEGRSSDEIAAQADGSTWNLVRTVTQLHDRDAFQVTKYGLVVRDGTPIRVDPQRSSLRSLAYPQVETSVDFIALVGGWSPNGVAARWVSAEQASRAADWLDRVGCLVDDGPHGWRVPEPERAEWVNAMSPSLRAALSTSLLGDPHSRELSVSVLTSLLLHTHRFEEAWQSALMGLETHLDGGSTVGVFDSLDVLRRVVRASSREEWELELRIYEARVDSLLQRADKAIAAADACLLEIDRLPEGPVRRRLRAHALVAAGTPRALVAREDEAVVQLQEALSILPEIETPMLELRARLMLGFVHYRLGRYAEAVRHANLAVRLADNHCSRAKQGHARYALALFDGDAPPRRSLELFDDALERLDDTSSPIQRAFALGGSVHPLLDLGDSAEAVARALENLEILDRFGSREATLAKETLGVALARSGNWIDAASRFAEAEVGFRERGRSYDQDKLTLLQFVCMARLGDVAAARRFAEAVDTKDPPPLQPWVIEELRALVCEESEVGSLSRELLSRGGVETAAS
jgi:tetratricopeptide (TPR) repeat protein